MQLQVNAQNQLTGFFLDKNIHTNPRCDRKKKRAKNLHLGGLVVYEAHVFKRSSD